jgi:hypothetical protein
MWFAARRYDIPGVLINRIMRPRTEEAPDPRELVVVELKSVHKLMTTKLLTLDDSLERF